MLPGMEKQDTNKALVTTLGLEMEINTFFRLTSPTVIKRLRETLPGFAGCIPTRRPCS